MFDYEYNSLRKGYENRFNQEDDRISILEAQLAQAKLIAEESDKKYEEVKYALAQKTACSTTMKPTLYRIS